MKTAIGVVAMLLVGSIAWGSGDGFRGYGEEAPADQGKLLFESVKLGTNGKSCATCHPGGRKLEWAATFPEDKLADLSNVCIVKTMKGKPLAVDSAEMISLVRHIKTLAGL